MGKLFAFNMQEILGTAVETENVKGSLAFQPIVIPEMPQKLPTLTVTLEDFEKTTSDVVIPNFEGGYFNPAMLPRFNAADQKLLKSSGETLFGLDRMAGAELAKYTEWKNFWAIVDEDRRKNPGLWKYQYRGGALEVQLKLLASKIMYKWFSYLAGKYILISSMDEIASDKRLMIHFSYAAWNGEGWFQKYSNALNKAIAKFPGNKDAIFYDAIKARTLAITKIGLPNKAIRQQGTHMMDLFKRLKLI